MTIERKRPGSEPVLLNQGPQNIAHWPGIETMGDRMQAPSPEVAEAIRAAWQASLTGGALIDVDGRKKYDGPVPPGGGLLADPTNRTPREDGSIHVIVVDSDGFVTRPQGPQTS